MFHHILILLLLFLNYRPIFNTTAPPNIHYAQVPRSSTYPSPRDIRVVRINDTTIQVFWSLIYHPSVERYIVHYNDKAENKPENQWSLFSPTNPGSTSAIISGLKPDAMYNVRVSAEFSSASLYDPSYASGTTRREGDLSEIHVADIYHRTKEIIQYDDQLSRPYNLTYVDLTANSVKLLFFFNETNLDPRRHIQKLEVHYEGIQNYVDGLGTVRSTSHHNLAGLISIPSTQGAREWLVTDNEKNYIVQTEEQYIFIYEAINEAIQSGQTEVLARNLLTHLQRLLQPINDSSLTEMELEFKRLANVKAQPSKFLSANNPANKFKNRLVNILPYENTRVCLSPVRGVEGSDYINASYIDGYRFKNGYIATQGPLTETMDDFWRMVWEHNVTIIVMLTKLKEMGREKCVQYWPSDRSTRYGYFIVDPVGAYNMPQYLLSEFKVTDSRDGQSRTVRHFLYTEWPEQGVPKIGEGFIDFIGQVHKTKEGFGQEGPIVVHCSAGAGRTGVFLTLSIVLERIRYEGVVDIFQTVKLLRTQRPALVQTEDQYQFCYRSALEYLGSFDNFVSS
ncbi:unnamed protein product [Rotaria sp. Silwood2]|nr:unnamed protein product [Rotaria sp. Silwood2]